MANDQQRLMSLACLFASTRVSAEPLYPVLESVRWSAAQVEQNLDALRGSGLATGQGDLLEIHQLIAQFVRARGGMLAREFRPMVLSGLAKVAQEFAQAQPWYQRAAEVKAQGDIHGRVYRTSLARSLGAVGQCMAEQSRATEAQIWFERAARARTGSPTPTRSIDSAEATSSLAHREPPDAFDELRSQQTIESTAGR